MTAVERKANEIRFCKDMNKNIFQRMGEWFIHRSQWEVNKKDIHVSREPNGWIWISYKGESILKQWHPNTRRFGMSSFMKKAKVIKYSWTSN